MANSELHQTKTNQHVTFPSENTKTYPPSVTKISNMILEAHKKSLPECPEYSEHSNITRTSDLLDTPPQTEVSRAVFKKSHTCGSLFAKCSCNNENQTKPKLYKSFTHSFIDNKIKRSSSPAVLTDIRNKSEAKRFSNPDLSTSLNNNIKQSEIRYKKNSNTVIKQVYLNHPEINFPITVEIQNDPEKNCDIIVPNRNNNLTSNLDYHKYTALSYENNNKCEVVEKKPEDPASKFLKDFGIFGPMGNGVSSIRKTSKGSNDSDVIQRIKKSSKIMCIDAKRNLNLPEDYEYLKTIVPRLENELSELECKYATIQSELLNSKKEILYKENQILRLQREIHKLKVSLLLFSI